MESTKKNESGTIINLQPDQNNSPITFTPPQGKEIPRDVSLEKKVLGSLMIDTRTIDLIMEMVTEEEIFSEPKHQHVYATIKSLYQRSRPIDLKTVLFDLKEAGKLDQAGGEHYVIGLTATVDSAAHSDYYGRILLQYFIRRRLLTLAVEMERDAYDDTTDVFDLLDKAERMIFETSEIHIKNSVLHLDRILDRTLKEIDELRENKQQDGVNGVPAGFMEIDELTNGWQPSDLIVVAARPGMGKTAFALSMIKTLVVDRKIPVAFFSLEMSSEQIAMRLLSSTTAIPQHSIRSGKLQGYEHTALKDKADELRSAPLYIDDTPNIALFELKAKIRRLVSKQKVRLLIIDYLQLIKASTQKASFNREQEIASISRELKVIAKELKIPVIALAQLSRAVEGRPNKRPMLSDLRESGAIEQDADIVSFLYRPEKYKMDWSGLPVDDGQPNDARGQAEFIIEKHRNGSQGSVRLAFEENIATFKNLGNTTNAGQPIPSMMNGQGGIADQNQDIHNTPFSIDEEDPF